MPDLPFVDVLFDIDIRSPGAEISRQRVSITATNIGINRRIVPGLNPGYVVCVADNYKTKTMVF
jgi:hypothetical protein